MLQFIAQAYNQMYSVVLYPKPQDDNSSANQLAVYADLQPLKVDDYVIITMYGLTYGVTIVKDACSL